MNWSPGHAQITTDGDLSIPNLRRVDIDLCFNSLEVPIELIP